MALGSGRWFAATLPLVLAASSAVFAQSLQVHTYTEADGLPAAEVRGMVQTADGRIWFGTRNGIAIYDGHSWSVEDETHGLPTRDQQYLALEPSGRMWAVSWGVAPSVSVREDGRWHAISSPQEIRKAMAILPLGGKSTRRALLGTASGLRLFDGDAWRPVPLVGGDGAETFPRVSALARWNDRVLVGTEVGVLHFVDGKSPHTLRVEEIPKRPAQALTPDGDRLWVVGLKRIGRFDGDRYVELPHEHDFGDRWTTRTASAVLGPDGGLFVAEVNQLFYWHPHRPPLVLGHESGLVGEGAQALLLTGGPLWISTLRGVSKVVSLRFANYGRRDGLLDDEVSAILRRKDGSIVLGHSRGLTYWNDEKRTWVIGGPERTRVMEMAEDEAGNLWIAAYRSGLWQIEPGGRRRHHALVEGHDYVSSVVVDRSGRPCVATNWEVLCLEDSGFVSRGRPTYRRTVLKRLFRDAAGRLYVSLFQNGLWRLDGASWTLVAASDDRHLNDVFAFLQHDDGTVWLGTAGGLCTVDTGRIVKVDEPRVDEPIYSLFEDRESFHWLGTSDGVVRWDGREARHYTREHGLAGRETNRAAIMQDDDGRLWIGTADGLSIYRPELDREPSVPPTVRILTASAGDRIYDAGREFRLPHDQHTVAFDYDAISYQDEKNVRVRVRLEGMDDEWQPAFKAGDRRIQFNYLPPGSYRLHLQAAGIEGGWSDAVRSARFVVLPPFWSGGWFRGSVLLAVALLGFVMHRLYAQQRYTAKLRDEVSLRLGELRRTEERYGVALRSISNGVVTTDLRGQIQLTNEAAQRLLGLTHEQTAGRSLAEVMPLVGDDGESDVTRQILNRTLGGEETISGDPLAYRGPDGDRLLEVSSAPLREGATEVHGAVLVLRDVTERLRLEREALTAQRIQSLGVLAGGIAHDFNNLLTIMLGNLSLLMVEDDSRRRRELVEQLEGAVLKSRDLTQQLLTFSRGGAPLRRTVNASEIIRESVSFTLSGTAVRAELDLADDLWPVRIDSGQISQALNNLLINANQAMPEGGVIRVSARNVTPVDRDGARTIEIAVADEGCGIVPDALPHVFDPYFSTKDEGHGLGLSTAYSVVKRHEGELTVESTPGLGTTFKIRLPASSEAPAATPAPRTKGSFGACRVLVVDDDEAVSGATAAILEQLGCEVVVAADGAEGVARYREGLESGRRFEAVLLDLTIPGGMGGREAMEHLRRLDAGVRAVVASGYSNDPVMAHYDRYGFAACIKKPFGLKELRRVLSQTLTENAPPNGLV